MLPRWMHGRRVPFAVRLPDSHTCTCVLQCWATGKPFNSVEALVLMEALVLGPFTLGTLQLPAGFTSPN